VQKANLMAEGKPVEVSDDDEAKTTIAKAIEQYLEDKSQQNRADATLYKLDNLPQAAGRVLPRPRPRLSTTSRYSQNSNASLVLA